MSKHVFTCLRFAPPPRSSCGCWVGAARRALCSWTHVAAARSMRRPWAASMPRWLTCTSHCRSHAYTADPHRAPPSARERGHTLPTVHPRSRETTTVRISRRGDDLSDLRCVLSRRACIAVVCLALLVGHRSAQLWVLPDALGIVCDLRWCGPQPTRTRCTTRTSRLGSFGRLVLLWTPLAISSEREAWNSARPAARTSSGCAPDMSLEVSGSRA